MFKLMVVCDFSMKSFTFNPAYYNIEILLRNGNI